MSAAVAEGDAASRLPPSPWGWWERRARLGSCLAALAAGLLVWAGLPPQGLWPLALAGFALLAWTLSHARTARGAALVGWLFGMGQFVTGLTWIGNAAYADIARFWWLVPIATLGLPAYLALYPMLVCLATRLLRPGPRAAPVLLAALWGLAEYARGHVLTGFPWHLAGYVWIEAAPVRQIAALVGVYGLTVLTVLAGASLPLLRWRGRWPVGLAGLLPLLLGSLWGVWRLETIPVPAPLPMTLRVVQAGIPQLFGGSLQEELAIIRRYLDLSKSGQGDAPQGPLLIAWPESAVRFVLARQTALAQQIAEALPPGATLIAGSLDVDAPVPEGEARSGVYNAAIVLASDGRLIDAYRKHHLVPGGEYMPLRHYLPLDAIAASDLDFSEGPGPRSLHVPGLPAVGVLICYESVFPSAVVARGAERPGFMLNVSNDAWFGPSDGPPQHFAIARMRAVEEGLSLARAVNTGISGLVDPFGRIVEKTKLGEARVLNLQVPGPLSSTIYSRFGEPMWLIPVIFVFISMVALRLINRHQVV